VHSRRFLGVAAFDLALTFALAYALSRLFSMRYLAALALSLLLGVVAHRLFCVRTTVDRLLFP